MSVGAAEMAFALELFDDIPDLTTRRMFGGMGFYSAGIIFALQLSDGRVLLKAPKGPFAERMHDLGGTQWRYAHKNGKNAAMPYWTLPDASLDDPENACALARQALEVLR